MRVLLDHNVNPRCSRLLPDHEVSHTYKMGWEELLNGELIAAAETAGFEATMTADKNLQYQQNLSGRKICIIVLNAWRITWQHIEPLAPQARAALEELIPGSFITINPASQM